MQDPRSSIGALPENLLFDNGSIAGEPVVASQITWSNSLTSEQSWPGFSLPINPSSFQYMQQSRHGELGNLGFCLGESSSSAAQHRVDHSAERKPEADTWNFNSQAVLSFENQQHLESSNAVLLGNSTAELNSSSNRTNTTGGFVFESLPLCDLNTISGVEENDDCQIIELPIQSSFGSSSNSLNLTSLDSQRTSRKRKAREMDVGQPSGEGSSNHFDSSGRSQFHFQIASSNSNESSPRQHGITIGNGAEPASSRLRLGVNDTISSSPLSLTASANVDSTVVNRHLWVNRSPQHSLQPVNSQNPNLGNPHGASSSRHSSRLVANNRVLDLNPAPVLENFNNLQGQAVSLHHSTVHRNAYQSRWSSTSARRYISSSMSNESNLTMIQESAARNVARSISEHHPMFLPPHEILNLNQDPANIDGVSGNITTGNGNLASSTRAGPSRGLNSSETSWSHQTPQQNRRRHSEIPRRSLLPPTGLESGGQNTGNGARSNQSGLANLGQRARSASLERRLNAAVGLSRSLRAFSGGDEGRRSAMPEHIRRIFDMMRRGEGLRFEDMLILDQSAFFAMADPHDRHRDMRMDVDNMSYEELLALEERIGNVCTGLTEENILKHMKQRKCSDDNARGKNETEPCSICREEYTEGEDVGKLECGHDFHRDCIKQWLMQKNLCPICKTTGLNI